MCLFPLPNRGLLGWDYQQRMPVSNGDNDGISSTWWAHKQLKRTCATFQSTAFGYKHPNMSQNRSQWRKCSVCKATVDFSEPAFLI